jgi:hypothetical protein
MQRNSPASLRDAHSGTECVPENQSTKMRSRQRVKIKEIGESLCAAGHVCLDKQANVLGLSRSTTWTVLQANHKATGLTAALINRMLAAPGLPSPVRAKILEYAEQKAAGLYGHKDRACRIFSERLSNPTLLRKKTFRC